MINIELTLNMWMALGLLLVILTMIKIKEEMPEIWQETDILFLGGCALTAMILVIHGWKLDPILLLQSGSDIFFMVFEKRDQLRLRVLILRMVTKITNMKKNYKKLKKAYKNLVEDYNELLSGRNKLKDNYERALKAAIYYLGRYKEAVENLTNERVYLNKTINELRTRNKKLEENNNSLNENCQFLRLECRELRKFNSQLMKENENK